MSQNVNQENYVEIGRQFVQFIENCLNEAPVEFGEGSGEVNLSEYRQQIIREVMNSAGEIAPKGVERVASFASYQGTHVYGCWCENRTTPIVVRAVNAAEARKLANSKKKSNAGEIIKVARLDEKDAQKARQGQWVRTRAGGDRPESYSEVASEFYAESYAEKRRGSGKECGGSYISKGYECRVGKGGTDDLSDSNSKQKGKLADSDREEIKAWFKKEDDKIANPDVPYDDEGEQIGTDLDWYRANLDPEIVTKMDELAATEGYNWDDWGDISAAAQVVAADRVARVMGVENESHRWSDEIDSELEKITGISFAEFTGSSSLIPVVFTISSQLGKPSDR